MTEVFMRALTLFLALAGCSDPTAPPDSTQESFALGAVKPAECDSSDLRLFSEPFFQGTQLCLGGVGSYTDLHAHFPNGIHSVIVGRHGARFRQSIFFIEDLNFCTGYKGVDWIVQAADSVTAPPTYGSGGTTGGLAACN
jgi:hypothetical protein